MKRTLLEELKRIHTLTYGKTISEDDSFLSKVLKGPEKVTGTPQKIDDPKKADLVSSEVDEFFNTLESAVSQGGVSQQQRGSMVFQKEVESMQIGLILLGYQLPKYGVDGLFGPETAAAVTKFTNDKLGGNTTVNESTNLVAQGGGLIGKPGIGTHNQSDWASGNAWDVEGPVGTDVYSITNGVVDKIRKDPGKGVVSSGTKKIYGDQITIKSSDGKPDVFYTHIDSNLNVGDQVKEGDVIGKIMQSGGITPHVHVGLSSGNLKDMAKGLNDAGGSSSASMIKATPEMLKKLIELLKEKGVKPEDLKQYIDPVLTGGGASFTDLDLTTEEGIKKYTEICQRFISTRSSNLLGITGEMLTKGAVSAFQNYKRFVPAELALAQLTAEGGFSNDPNARPIKTKNPFNVGNVDTGQNVYENNVQNGINKYYNLIAKNYLGNGKTANDLVKNFVNKDGSRYATERDYEIAVGKIANNVNKISQQVTGNVGNV